MGDEMSGISSCQDCNSKDDIFLHHRVTFRRGVVVGVLYLYGSDATPPQGLVSWFITQVFSRIPDSAARAPERVGGDPAATVAPPSDGGGQSQSANPALFSALVTAKPNDLAVKLDEAGKGAKLKAS